MDNIFYIERSITHFMSKMNFEVMKWLTNGKTPKIVYGMQCQGKKSKCSEIWKTINVKKFWSIRGTCTDNKFKTVSEEIGE